MPQFMHNLWIDIWLNGRSLSGGNGNVSAMRRTPKEMCVRGKHNDSNSR